MTIYTSSQPDIDLPNIDLLTLLFDSTWTYSTDSTIIHAEAANPTNSITKSEARHLVQRIAHLLRRQYGIGVDGPGKDVVLTMSCGNPFIPVFFYSILAAGGVFSGASTTFRSTELVTQIQNAEARLLVCTAEHEDVMIAAAKQCNIPLNRILILDWRTPQHWRLLTVPDKLDVLAANGPATLDWPRPTDPTLLKSTPVALLYSSGTTGLPKGVLLSHTSLVASTITTMFPAVLYKRRHPDFVFSTIAHLPMANIAGVALYSCNPFYMGGTAYWMEHYEYDKFVALHARLRVQYQFSVPPVWLRIAKDEGLRGEFDGLRVAVTGSAPIGEGVMQEVAAKVGRGKACVSQTWGTTETAGVICALDWEGANEGWAVGEPCPGVRVRVVDEEGRDMREEGVGELMVKGPILAMEYYRNEVADREGFVDGWYRSGDIGVVRDGRVWILDRKKELIKYKGSQVAPAELEAVLNGHEGVADAAVIGVWDASRETELPRAYVVRKHPGLTEENVQEWVKARLADYKRLRGGVVFVDSIPKSASGKILRKELKVLAEAEKKRPAKL